MWKYTEINAGNSISLHDCRTDDIQIVGNDMIVSFPDGFWITPVSNYIDHDTPLKTGPSQVRFCGIDIDSIALFKTTYLFRKPVLCRRIQMQTEDFLKRVNDGKHELEFLYEYHNDIFALYQCCLWKKNNGLEAECQLELTAGSIEYRWNEIRPDREW